MSRSTCVPALCSLWLVACSSTPDDPPGAVTVISYNVASSTAGSSGTAIAARLLADDPDFVGVQECRECDTWLVGLLGSEYASTDISTDANVIYNAARWDLRDQGDVLLGDNDDGWGKRTAQWGKFERRDGAGAIYVYSTHWCVTIRNDTDRCTVERQLDYVDTLLESVRSHGDGAATVVAGDFNVFDGFAAGPVVGSLTSGGLVDTFGELNPQADGTSFIGNDWAPPGRIDYVFATTPVDVLEAFVDQSVDASDHYPVFATLDF
jgi:endonuclease/exonuclease/phosphatase family metal-dependent hydrolase